MEEAITSTIGELVSFMKLALKDKILQDHARHELKQANAEVLRSQGVIGLAHKCLAKNAQPLLADSINRELERVQKGFGDFQENIESIGEALRQTKEGRQRDKAAQRMNGLGRHLKFAVAGVPGQLIQDLREMTSALKGYNDALDKKLFDLCLQWELSSNNVPNSAGRSSTDQRNTPQRDASQNSNESSPRIASTNKGKAAEVHNTTDRGLDFKWRHSKARDKNEHGSWLSFLSDAVLAGIGNIDPSFLQHGLDVKYKPSASGRGFTISTIPRRPATSDPVSTIPVAGPSGARPGLYFPYEGQPPDLHTTEEREQSD